MNDENTTNDLAEQRLARDLRSAAGRVPLAPGSELTVVANGRRRRHRRRQANAIMLVAATGIGTALTIRQLARNGDSSVATDTLPSTEVTASVPQSAVPAPTTPSDSTATSETAPASVPLETTPPVNSDMAPAQIVDSNMVWNVVEPDSTQAVAYGDMTWMTTESGLPGVILATAPGRSEQPVPQLWRSDDGVNWTPIDLTLPFGSLYGARFTADGVYVAGTSPGIAATQPNPLLLGVSHDEGSTWDQVELPVDTNAGRRLPLVLNVASSAMVYPIEGGAVVWLYSNAQLDYEAIAEMVGVDLNNSRVQQSDGANVTPEGVYVPVDSTCQPAPIGSVPVFVPPTTGVPDPSTLDGCDYRLVGWDELGVPQESVDLAFNRTPREFRVVGTDVTELEVPEGVSGAYAGTAQEPLFTTDDGRHRYQMGADGVLVETDAPGGNGYPLGSNGTTDFVQTNDDSGMYWKNSNGIGASRGGGPWVYTDWTDLAGGGRLGYMQNMAVTNAGVVEVLQVAPDSIAAQGGVSVSSGGFTASRASGRAPIVITNDSTGEQVDLTRVWYGPDGVTIVDADGNQIGTMDGPTFQSVLNDPGRGLVPEDFLVAVSADGVHVSVESIPELLGIDASDISSIPRISAAGNTTVIAVTLKQRNADGVPRQLVLVGTPAGVINDAFQPPLIGFVIRLTKAP